MNNKLEFYWRMNDYGLRATPERLVRFSDDEENATINLEGYYLQEGKEYRYSIGYFWYNRKEPCWEFKFVGDRFTKISDEDIKPIWAMLKLAYKTLDEWKQLNSEDD